MSYNSVVEMVGSRSLTDRVTAAAAQRGVQSPAAWARENIWELAVTSDWSAAWDYARATRTEDHNPDTGQRPGVVSDAMIWSAVDAHVTAEEAASA